MPPADDAAAGDETAWLSPDEARTWIALIALVTALPASLDAQLQRDSGMSYFEYTVLSRLAERPDGTAQMSELAAFANGSQSRLSHVARRLEARGHMTRRPMPGDGRITLAELTETGAAAVRAAAPGHVEHVRRMVFDAVPAERVALMRSVLLGMLDAVDPRAAQLVSSWGDPATS